MAIERKLGSCAAAGGLAAIAAAAWSLRDQLELQANGPALPCLHDAADGPRALTVAIGDETLTLTALRDASAGQPMVSAQEPQLFILDAPDHPSLGQTIAGMDTPPAALVAPRAPVRAAIVLGPNDSWREANVRLRN